MANEIVLATSLSITKNGTTTSASVSKTITQSGDQTLGNVQIVGTSSETVNVGDVVTIGYIHFKNLDATNFVSIHDVSPCVAAAASITLKPGESAAFPTRQPLWYAIADTANVNLHVIATEL